MKQLCDNVTNKRYTLVIEGEVILNWDDLKFLRECVESVPLNRKTFIHYNKPGINQHVHGWS